MRPNETLVEKNKKGLRGYLGISRLTCFNTLAAHFTLKTPFRSVVTKAYLSFDQGSASGGGGGGREWLGEGF